MLLDIEIIGPLLLNAALLITVAHVLNLVVDKRALGSSSLWTVATGLMLGALGIGIMTFAWVAEPGLVIDLRSVLLSISGLFFGTIPTLIAIGMAAGYRLMLGGVGAVPGSFIILLSGAIGLAWRAWRRPRLEAIGWLELYALGIVVNSAMLATLSLLLPGDLVNTALLSVGLPILLIYPLATVALGLLMSGRIKSHADARALADSEQRYRSLFRDNKAPMLILDPKDRKVVSANLAAGEFYGVSPEQLAGSPLAKFDPGLRTFTPSRQDVHEARHPRADGSFRDVEVVSSPISVGERELLHLVIHDISNRKETEQRLITSEERRASEHHAALERQRRAQLAALNLMEDAVQARRRAEVLLTELQQTKQKLEFALQLGRAAGWEMDLADLTVHRSDDHDRIFGPQAGQEIWHYRDVLEFVLPEDRGGVEQSLLAALASTSDWQCECRIRRTDGAIRWVWLSGTHRFDDTGVAVALVGVVQDVTERRDIEDRLRQLSQAVEQSGESIVITDLEGNIEYVNEAFVRSTGYTLEEVRGRNPRILQSGRTPRKTYEELWNALTSGSTWSGEFCNRTKDGRVFYETVTISPLRRPDGAVTHYVAVKFDLTEQKQLVTKLEHYQEHLEELVEQRTVQHRIHIEGTFGGTRRAAHRRARRGSPQRRGSQPGQEHVPRQHEP